MAELHSPLLERQKYKVKEKSIHVPCDGVIALNLVVALQTSVPLLKL